MRPIDADKLEQIIKENIKDYEATNDPIRCDANKILLSTVRGMPTVEAEIVKHSYWENLNILSLRRCHTCGHVECYNANYCANCGEKMDGGEGNEN